MPASTVYEPPIRPAAPNSPLSSPDQLPSPANSDLEDIQEQDELHIQVSRPILRMARLRELIRQRLGGIDPYPGVMPSALSILTPPSSSSTFPPPRARWEPLQTELWLGGIERYNSKMEGYEAITCLEVIEHLDPNLLSRFGVNTMGTYRPRLMLITTPVSLVSFLILGIADEAELRLQCKVPSSLRSRPRPRSAQTRLHRPDRTYRASIQVRSTLDTSSIKLMYRHSDHKLEMTSGEFREWAEASAADWG